MKKQYRSDMVDRHVPREPIPKEVQAKLLRPGEILSILDAFPVAFQPLGTLEWHGRHNPIGCDSIKAERLCIEAAKQVGGMVMPTIHFSVDAIFDAGHGLGYGMDSVAGFPLPGSFYQTDVQLCKNILLNACSNYLARGVQLVVIVSGHNPQIQQDMASEVCYAFKREDGKEPVAFTMEYAVIEDGNPRRHSDHAAQYETSMMLYLEGGRTNMQANDGVEIPALATGGRRPWNEATVEDGEQYFALQVEGMCRFAQEKLELLRR